MPRAATEASLRRIGACGLLALILVPTAAYVASASVSIARTQPAWSIAQLALHDDHQARVLDDIDTATLDRAIVANPLDQTVVNVAMVRDMRQHGGVRQAAWIATLSRMGWRDNAAEWNRLYVAAKAQDLPTVLDVSDALLRRQQMVEQIIPVLSIAEGDAPTRRMIVDRLVSRPIWREAYLQTTTTLVTPAQIVARYATVRALQRRGSPLTVTEARANAFALDHGGRPDLGYAVWASAEAGVKGPLNDPVFARVSRRTNDDNIVPYEWTLFTGDGYSTDAFMDSGHSLLEIRWDGRGVPVFARQRTTARPGLYDLLVDAPEESRGDLSTIDFRLVCDGTAIPFRPVAGTPMHLFTAAPIPCAYPLIEIAGDIQAAATPRQLTLRGLRLARLK